jgi:hypothetical protein
MVEDASSRHKTEPNRLSRHPLVSLGPSILLMAIMGSMTPSPAAVYECRDAEGKSVLTNRQGRLRSCRSIINKAAPVATSPASEMTPQHPSAAASPNEFIDAPQPSPALPSFNPYDTDSGPPPRSSCPLGLNPLNPLIATPCASPQPQSSTIDGEPSLSR